MDQILKDTKQRIWNSLGLAIGAEPRQARTIVGASGLEHQVQSISVDDKTDRVIVIANEPNPRLAALMQVDIQTTMPNQRVLVARPVVFDLGIITKKIFQTAESAQINFDDLSRIIDLFHKMDDKRRMRFIARQTGGMMEPVIRALQNVPLPTLGHLIDVIQQASYLDWKQLIPRPEADAKSRSFSLAGLLAIDNFAGDRRQGVCPIPLFEFSEKDWELFASGQRIDEARERLRALGIYQFFFPPADQLTLGLVENGLSRSEEIVAAMERAPHRGHILSANELVPEHNSIAVLLEELKERGYLAEGEFGLDVTPSGKSTRFAIKFRPSESVFQRILNRFNLNVSVNPSDILRRF